MAARTCRLERKSLLEEEEGETRSARVSRCTRRLWYTRENRRDERGRGVGVLDVSTRLGTLVLWGSRRKRERERLVRVYVLETGREKVGEKEGILETGGRDDSDGGK